MKAHAIRSALLLLGASPLLAQTTVTASLGPGGAAGDADSVSPTLALEGRFVAFTSHATNLSPADPGALEDAYVRDLATGVTELVSVDSAGVQLSGLNAAHSISADGRYVAFQSDAPGAIPGDLGSDPDVFVRDRVAGTTTAVSVAIGGGPGDAASDVCVLSPDGRFVAFRSRASNLVPGDANGEFDVFVRDLQTFAIERVNLGPGGVEAVGGDSYVTSLSGDGRYVEFSSTATNLVPNDFNNERDVFVRDRLLGTTTRITVSTLGDVSDGDSHAGYLSADGRFATYVSLATNLVPGDANGVQDVFVHELATGTTTRASVSSTGVEGDAWSHGAGISADGRFVLVMSDATNLVPNDAGGFRDVFLHDRWTGRTSRAGLTSTAGAPNADSWCWGPALSADGRRLAFFSTASNVVPGTPGGVFQVYVRDRGDASAFAPLCAGDAASCPCGNAGAPGRGCENSAGTGGAQLVASGVASLAADSVQLVSSGELASSLSIVLQGDVLLAGVAFGDGRRCAGGALKRLYSGNASGGVYSAPAPGDPPVSARSAALGDPIAIGTTRVVQVYYRDPDAGFCPAPAGSTFNVSSAVAIAWGP